MTGSPTSIRLTKDTSHLLDRFAHEAGKSRSKIVEEALKNYIGSASPEQKWPGWKERYERLMKYDGIAPTETAEEIDARIRAFRGDE